MVGGSITGSSANGGGWTVLYSNDTATTCTSSYTKYAQSYPITFSDLDDLAWDNTRCRLIEKIPDRLPAGKRTMILPDGAKLLVDDDGNYRIEDKDAKVTYKANRIREFSPHLNASDLLAQFVGYIGGLGVKRDEVMGLPIHLFISWLILEAAERDGDPVPSDVMPVQSDPVLRLAVKPKCLKCGRFIPRLHYRQRFPYCSPDHAAAHIARLPGPAPRRQRLLQSTP
jgi:hypothetical protein